MRHNLTLLILAMVVTANLAMAAGGTAARGEQLAGDALKQSTPATHYIWTDKLWYQQGDSITLRWTFDPQTDGYPFTVFAYWENVETGDRKYVANGGLTANVEDIYGHGTGSFAPTQLPPTTGQVLLTTTAQDTGYYHFVAELRDVTGTQVIKSAWAKYVVADGTVDMGFSGDDTEITQDTTWHRNMVYRIRHQVFVHDGVTLTVEPGTLVVAQGQNAVLVIERGGKLIADGRREMPIVMTCDAPLGERFSGCWAGIIMLGKAPINVEDGGGGTAIAEGVIPAERPVYGGNDPEDNSGILRYVRVEFAGVDFSNEIQPNAFGFHGIGSGTIIDHIQAHDGEDDGCEFFGGTANVKYLVSDGSKDDSLDWTHGWRGNVQFVYVLQDNVEGDRGIEADNFEFGHENLPRSHPNIWNITFVGSPVGGRGVELRRGTSATIENFVIENFAAEGLNVSDDATFAQITNGTTVLGHGIFYNNNGATGLDQFKAATQPFISSAPAISFENPELRNVRYEPNPDPRRMDTSPAGIIGGAAAPPSNGFFDTSATYRGAFGDTNWMDEWTFFGTEDAYVAP